MNSLKKALPPLLFIVLNLAFSQVFAQNNIIPPLSPGEHTIEYTIPCANNGVGEIAKGELTFIPTAQGSGLPAGQYTLRVAGVLNGFATDMEYRATGVAVNISTPDPANGAFTKSTVERLHFRGGGIVFTMAIVIHLTSKGGNNPVLVEIEHYMEKCLNKTLRN